MLASDELAGTEILSAAGQISEQLHDLNFVELVVQSSGTLLKQHQVEKGVKGGVFNNKMPYLSKSKV